MPGKEDALAYQTILQQKVINPHRGKKAGLKNKLKDDAEAGQNQYQEGVNIFQVTKDPNAMQQK